MQDPKGKTVILTWEALQSGTQEGYKLPRAKSYNDFSQTATLASTDATATDTGTPWGWGHQYWLIAVVKMVDFSRMTAVSHS